MEEGLHLLGQQAILVKAPIFLKVLPKVSKGIELQQVVSGTAAEHKLGTHVLTVNNLALSKSPAMFLDEILFIQILRRSSGGEAKPFLLLHLSRLRAMKARAVRL